jgi:hypothetical protein
MRDMDISFTGNPDVDFRRQMIPHHQGAIDMARVALRLPTLGRDSLPKPLSSSSKEKSSKCRLS